MDSRPSQQRLPDVVKAKGFNEHCIVIKCVRGEPTNDLSEVLSPSGVEEYVKLVKEIADVRNLLWAYRLLHRHDPLPKVDLNIKARERQLFSPLIRLFLGTSALKNNILPAISNYVSERRKSKVDSLHAFLYQHITGLINNQKTNLLNSTIIWQSIKNELPGQEVKGKPLSYETSDFGTLSQKTIIQKLKEIFGATESGHHGSSRALKFDLDALDKAGKAYSLDVNVQVLVDGKDGDASSGQSLKANVGLDRFTTEKSTPRFGTDGTDGTHSERMQVTIGAKSDVETAKNQQENQEKSQEIISQTGKSTIGDEPKEPFMSQTSVPSVPEQPVENPVNQSTEEEEIEELEAEPKNYRDFEDIAMQLIKESNDRVLDHKNLKNALISSGSFSASEAHYVIQYALKAKFLEELDYYSYRIPPEDLSGLFEGEGPE